MKTLLITAINIYFKLPCIGAYCKNTNIIWAFLPLKIGKFFSSKDSTLKFLPSYAVC